MPREVYNTLETMLPNSRAKLLELWAATDAVRPGWDHLAEAAMGPAAMPAGPGQAQEPSAGAPQPQGQQQQLLQL